MGLLYKTNASCGCVRSYEHAQTSDQQTLDLHHVPLVQLELIRPQWTVVNQCHTGTCDWDIWWGNRDEDKHKIWDFQHVKTLSDHESVDTIQCLYTVPHLYDLFFQQSIDSKFYLPATGANFDKSITELKQKKDLKKAQILCGAEGNRKSCVTFSPSVSLSHRLYIKMDFVSPLPPSIQKWNQNIPDTSTAILQIWSQRLFPKSLTHHYDV